MVFQSNMGQIFDNVATKLLARGMACERECVSSGTQFSETEKIKSLQLKLKTNSVPKHSKKREDAC